MAEKRFVQLYEEEIAKIEDQIDDLKKLDEKDFDAKTEVEETARSYYRAFDREFYDVCEGKVSDEEFFDLWEREEELRSGLNSINSLEGEQKQLEKELLNANEEENLMNDKIIKARRKKKNRKAFFVFFLLMAIAFAGLVSFYLYDFKISVKQYLGPIIIAALIILLFLLILFHSQKKAGNQLKFLERMITHKNHAGKRLEDNKREIGNELKFYYEKFETIFSYISEEQWKLFEFCGKVSARLSFSDSIAKAQSDLEQLLEKNQWKTSSFWMYHPKVLYDLIKRREYLASLNQRKDICNKELAHHEQILEEIGENDSETIE